VFSGFAIRSGLVLPCVWDCGAEFLNLICRGKPYTWPIGSYRKVCFGTLYENPFCINDLQPRIAWNMKNPTM
jgi:hypothetical protein